jgi:hypothetical protein|tara:strand:+ start:6616 stop:7173 length:558 start_codon:yes stop_codon:yes gene_type:complete
MKLIENIKNALGKRKIDKILQSNKRRLKVVNYSNAKSIGVIYPVTTTDYQYFINKFIDYLREEVGFKSIVSIGYCDTKKIPNFIINQSIKYQYFTRSDLNRNNFGISKEVKDFIKNDFEILIDFSRDNINPIKHIIASSKSGLKIGRHSKENEKYFDFMVEMEKTAPVSQFINQVNTFLKQVKPN